MRLFVLALSSFLSWLKHSEISCDIGGLAPEWILGHVISHVAMDVVVIHVRIVIADRVAEATGPVSNGEADS